MMFKNNQLTLILLIVLSVVAVYFLPAFASQAIFLVFLALAWRSNNSYFWVAFALVILGYPGGMFEYWGEGVKSLPTYALPGVTLRFLDLLFSVLLVKALICRRRINYRLSLLQRWLFVLFLIVLTFSFVADFSLNSLKRTILDVALPLSLLFSVPKLINDENDLSRLAGLLFPWVYVALATQIANVVFRVPLVQMIPGSGFSSIARQEVAAGRLIRPSFMPFMNLSAFTLAIYFHAKKSLRFNQGYLLTIIIMSLLSVLLSATRGWSLAYLFTVTVYLLFMNMSKDTLLYIAMFGMFAVLAYQVPIINEQVNQVFERLSTVMFLFAGDLSAGGTSVRMTVRSEEILEYIRQNPIIGYGFTNVYFQHRDVHVGNQNMILNIGILGYLLMILAWLSLFIHMLKLALTSHGKIRKTYFALVVLYISTMIIHSSSTQLYGFDTVSSHPQKMLFLAVEFSLLSVSFSKFGN